MIARSTGSQAIPSGMLVGLDAIAQGAYYRKLLGCKSSIIAWSHRSRFETGLNLIGAARPKLLDYGCGDGTFLAMASDRIVSGCGADIDPSEVAECRTRLAAYTNIRFCGAGDLADASHDGAYDLVTCMETLEHCTAPVVDHVLRELARLVSASGRVIISVPIETGPAFLAKWTLRKMAAWRNLSDYRYYESYTANDAWRMIFATVRTQIQRPVYGPPESPSHSHYGFNWRFLRERVRERLRIVRTLFSPMRLLGPWANSQAWFVCRRPA